MAPSLAKLTTPAPPAPPPVFNATADSIISKTRDLIKHAKAVQDSVIANNSPESATFASVLVPIVDEENHRLYDRQLIEFYSTVSTDEATREASRKAARLFAEFDTDTNLRKDLYILIAAVEQKGEANGAGPEPGRLLVKLLQNFKDNGLALSEDDRERLRQLNEELNKVKGDYLRSCSDKKPEFWFTREELEGVSHDLLDRMKLDSEGKVLLELSMMEYHNVMHSAKNRETRRRVFANQAIDTNLTLLQRTAKLRYEKAKLLGFRNYAEYLQAGRTEPSPQKIHSFLNDLLQFLGPSRDQLMSQRRERKRLDLAARGEVDDGKYYPWDHAYYMRNAPSQNDTQTSQSVKEDKRNISDYFALEETVDRMLKIFSDLFGLVFEKINTEAQQPGWVWHEDVQLFAVWDDGHNRQGGSEEKVPNSFLGYLYTDMYPRPGKQGNFSCQPIRPAFTESDGTRKYTSTGLICNFEKPTRDKPSLLAHHEVVLLFHELGHGIHDLVARTDYARFHGASTDDFNEAPSQMLEQWCWYAPTLQRLSQLHSSSTREPVPEDLIAKILSGKKLRGITTCLSLLNMSLFDLAFNMIETLKEAEEMDTTQLYYQTANKVYGFDIPENGPAFQSSETNHFTVDGMFIYLTTQLYAYDMFDTAFKADPMNRDEGLRYRRTVIGKGSSQASMELLIEFLGRPPRADAFHAALSET